MTYKPFCDCGASPTEGTTGKCASCNRLDRKFASATIPEDAEPIKKQSAEMKRMMGKYGVIRKKFLYRKWCAYHGKPCIPTTVHHAAGRVGFIDEEAREKGIPALLDVRYFVPLCMDAHRYIEENPKFAKENGYSESRLSIKD